MASRVETLLTTPLATSSRTPQAPIATAEAPSWLDTAIGATGASPLPSPALKAPSACRASYATARARPALSLFTWQIN